MNNTHPIKGKSPTNIWEFLCDEFGIEYEDNVTLYKELNNLIYKLNKSSYKDKNEPQWINITLEM